MKGFYFLNHELGTTNQAEALAYIGIFCYDNWVIFMTHFKVRKNDLIRPNKNTEDFNIATYQEQFNEVNEQTP